MPTSDPNRFHRALVIGLLLACGAPFTAAAQDSYVPGRLLVKFRQGSQNAAIRSAVQSVHGRIAQTMPGIGVMVLELPDRANERAQAAALAQRAEVEFAEMDWIFPLQSAPNDPQYPNQWHLTRIQAPSAWGVTTGHEDVIIAILDTGVDANHPDLAGRLVPGWNVYNANSDTSDVHGHGTKVAGAAAAAGNNSVGIASVAYTSRVMPIRIAAADGSATASAMANGLVWSADRLARVANISYAASSSSAVRTAAQYFQNAGGVVCISAGNQGMVLTHADNPHVLTVSATGTGDALASFTNTGTPINVAAPGVGILTTQRGGGYGSSNGTSFSSPVVAGIAALVFSANPHLTGLQAQQIIMDSADDLGPSGWDPGYGWGRVNAARAVSAARAMGSGSTGGSTGGSGGGTTGGSGGGTQPPLDTTPPTISISTPSNGGTVSGNVEVRFFAQDDVGVVRVDLLVNGTITTSSSTSPFTVRWNTNKIARGTHVLQGVAYDAAGNVAVSPTVSVRR
ncbi:MAG: S8 family serine peptidase [Phycisphaeraceae bacterium]|nr:S8 family serine peptidase [Phycisphaeraceae bacterium]